MRKPLSGIFVLTLIVSGTAAAQEAPASGGLTLDECIKIALKENPTVIAAQHSYTAAKGEVYRAWGGLLPSVNLGLDMSFFKSGFPRINQATGQFQQARWSLTYRPSVSLNQTLFNGGANYYNVAWRADEKEAAYQALQSTRQQMVLSVKENYFALLKAKMLLDIQKDAVKRGEEQLKVAQTRYDLGSASLSDVLKAKVLYGNDQLALVSAENSYELAKANLNFILNRDVNTPVEIEEKLPDVQNPYTLEQALAQAKISHPGLRQARADYSASRAQVGIARAAYVPEVSWGLTRSWSVPDTRVERLLKFDQVYGTWSVFISANFPLFNGFNREATFLASRVNSDTKKENLARTENQVALEVKQAFLGIAESQKKLQVSEENEKSSQEDLNLAKEKYNLGAATILEVLDAEVNFKTVQSNRVQALFDYHLAIANLEKAMGRKY